MRARWISLAFLIAAICVAGASCRTGEKNGKDRTVYIPGENTALVLNLDSPATGQFTTFASLCEDAGAKSLLISVDTATTAAAYTLLWDLADEALYNCNGPCTGPIEQTLPDPVRIVVEAITLTAPEYLGTAISEFDVVCRGVADLSQGMGAIAVATSPTPEASPLESPTPNPTTKTITATVPMLRIGDFNGTFDAGPRPIARHLAASSLVPREIVGTLRTTSGGHVVAGGGIEGASTLTTAIYEFDPATIGFTAVGNLQSARYGLSASAITDSSGSPIVLFAGGSTDATTPFAATTAADVFRRGNSNTQPLTMLAPRAFHSASYVHTHDTNKPVVVIIGGCSTTAVNGTARADYEYFFGNLTADPGGCGTNPGLTEFCRPNAGGDNSMAEGHCQHASGQIIENTNPSIFVAGGMSANNAALMTTYTFSAATVGSFTAQGTMSNTARGLAGEPLSTDVAAVWGGFGSAATLNATSTWRNFTAGAGTVPSAGVGMLESRGFHSSRLAKDGTVLVSGGVNLASEVGGGLRSVERLSPATVGGSFEYVTRAGAANVCADGTDVADCVQMAGARYGHQTVMIEGSSTWLNGALLVVGGGPEPELFVPSYQCNASGLPIDVNSAAVTGVDYCDRDRTKPALTDLTPAQ